MGEVNRVATNFIEQMNGTLTLGSTEKSTDVRNLRALAFAEFLRGLSLGYNAMVYDSSSIVSPGMTKTGTECTDFGGVCAGALHSYQEVHDSAQAAFDRALAYTNPTAAITGTGGFPIPATWLPAGPVTMTQVEFSKLIHSYKARIRANIARTAAEAVDWTKVVADAQAGITADHVNTTSTTSGPFYGWRQQYDAADTWHQMPGFIIGMADNSGSYAAWITTPLGSRGAGNTPFFMTTPDVRFPQGATRALQQADFSASSCNAAATKCKRYFENRPAGNDVFSGDGWGWSNYNFVRYRSWVRAGDGGSARNGDTPFFTLVENDMLQAEGLYKLGGNDAAVATLINKSRTRGVVGGVATGGGLPAVTAANRATPLPGGVDCVPKTPDASGGLTCGGTQPLFEALKWEKRIETAYSHFGAWFFDHRRWDDLAKNTPLYWAVPYQDLQARGRSTAQLYSVGPASGAGAVAPGSAYGW
jgi:hypothetical protein